MNYFSDEKPGMVEVCVGGEPRVEKQWGVTRGSFLWSDTKRGGSYSENFSNREYCTDLLRVGEVAGASL